jgi:hypothetical protein
MKKSVCGDYQYQHQMPSIFQLLGPFYSVLEEMKNLELEVGM